MKKLFEMKESVLFEPRDRKPVVSVQTVNRNDIAIIGVSGRMGSAEEKNMLWEQLRSGQDAIADFPEVRKKRLEAYLIKKGVPRDRLSEIEFFNGAFLPEIDNFDCHLFSIPPKEAELMDPAQRIWLETVWETIEDAGYGGKLIRGTKTGVFLGHSDDFGVSYRDIIQTMNPSAVEHSGVGNIKSTIAGRIAYLLDLKGPSLIVDTACSSSLVAVHLACNSLRSNECDMAIAGGIKLQLLPVRPDNPFHVGLQLVGNIGAHDGRARTFDDRSDGTGMGEGTAAVLLKPLYLAVQDRDHIYAVIKGSAMNQDGTSIGITAPNSAAQEQVILDAWAKAGIDPGTITYMEAHGTGTPLGDPVEISGMERAFRKFTQHKQFCGVGSVKTNLGHLDNASGMAGLLKLIMSLQHQQLPPTIHFESPNKKINFVDSPVYVVNRLSPWHSGAGLRRCGISGFGLSGTNCHLVLEESHADHVSADEELLEKRYMFVLSAKSKKALHELVLRYQHLLDQQKILPNLGDICFTALTGREHFEHRIAMAVSCREELIRKIALLAASSIESLYDQGIFYGSHKLVPEAKPYKEPGDLTEDERMGINGRAQHILNGYGECKDNDGVLSALCQYYIAGADVDWGALFTGKRHQKVSLPTYPFQKTKCWVQPLPEVLTPEQTVRQEMTVLHPLLHTLLADSSVARVFHTTFDVTSQWVLREHKIMGSYIVPGTTYLEMAREACRSYDAFQQVLEMEDVRFISPLRVDKEETSDVYTILKNYGDCIEFNVSSALSNGEWVIHAEGKVRPAKQQIAPEKVNMGHIAEMEQRDEVEQKKFSSAFIEVGERWKSIQQTYTHGDEALLHIVLPESFSDDLKEYVLHPSLMDCAMNGVNPHASNEYYLPYQYKKLTIYGPTPRSFYSSLLRSKGSNNDTATFDVKLFDESGTPFAVIHGYTVKKVRQAMNERTAPRNRFLYELGWTEQDYSFTKNPLLQGPWLVLQDAKGVGKPWLDFWKNQGKKLIIVEPGPVFMELAGDHYTVGSKDEDYIRLLEMASYKECTSIIHMGSLADSEYSNHLEELEDRLDMGLRSLFCLVKGLGNGKFGRNKPNLIVISNNVNAVTKQEPFLNPYGKALFGLAKTVEKEFPGMNCRCLDLELGADPAVVTGLTVEPDLGREVALRKNRCYQEVLRPLQLQKEASVRPYRQKGVYIITGGTGGIGLEIAQYLARFGNAHICLIHRSELPPKEQWLSVLETSGNTRLKLTIEKLMKLDSAEVEFSLHQADVTDVHTLERVLAEIRSRYGEIHGVFHGAGVAGDGILMRKDDKTFNRVTSPKIQGTLNLDYLTRQDHLDFFVVFSSISSFAITAGQGDYAAANAFLDAYAEYSTAAGRPMLSINWAPWLETGMAHDYQVDLQHSVFKGLSNKDAIGQLDQAMQMDLSRLIIGELNSAAGLESVSLPSLAAEIVQFWRPETRKARNLQASIEHTELSNSSVQMTGKNESGFTGTERKIGEIWANTLGLAAIDIYDNFYHLGGDSLIAIRLLKSLESAYPGVMDITDIFTYSSIVEMAAFIDRKNEDAGQKAAIPGSMTIPEILDLLAEGKITTSTADLLLSQYDEGR